MSMVKLQKHLMDLSAERANVEAKYKTDVGRLTADMDAVKKHIGVASVGLDADKIAVGRTVLNVRGLYARAGDDRAQALRAATTDLVLSGGIVLSREYFATKSYDRWHGQYVTCEYGMCPRHGSIIFEIGMSPDCRKRLRDGGCLTEVETEAAVYLLTVLPQLQDAEAAAVTKAA